MGFDNLLLLIHIAAAAVWLGAGASIVLLSSKASADSSEHSFVRQMEWIGPRIGPFVALGVVGTGIWMVLRSDAYAFSEPWVIGGIVGFAVLLLIGIGYHSRQYKRVQSAASASGQSSAEVRRLAKGSFRAARVEAVILLLMFVLMVFKPTL